jgi:hypothetical protein
LEIVDIGRVSVVGIIVSRDTILLLIVIFRVGLTGSDAHCSGQVYGGVLRGGNCTAIRRIWLLQSKIYVPWIAENNIVEIVEIIPIAPIAPTPRHSDPSAAHFKT